MGVIICDKHGPTGITLVCEHIRVAVIKGQAMQSMALVTDLFTPKQTFLCPACDFEFNHLFIDSEQVNKAFEQWENHQLQAPANTFLNILFQPACGQCFKEFVKDKPPAPSLFNSRNK